MIFIEHLNMQKYVVIHDNLVDFYGDDSDKLYNDKIFSRGSRKEEGVKSKV